MIALAASSLTSFFLIAHVANLRDTIKDLTNKLEDEKNEKNAAQRNAVRWERNANINLKKMEAVHSALTELVEEQ